MEEMLKGEADRVIAAMKVTEVGTKEYAQLQDQLKAIYAQIEEASRIENAEMYEKKAKRKAIWDRVLDIGKVVLPAVIAGGVSFGLNKMALGAECTGKVSSVCVNRMLKRVK